MDNIRITDLYDLSHTAAADYLKGFTYPWEALKGISELIISLGKNLDPNEYDNPSENVWVHKTAKVFPVLCTRNVAYQQLTPDSYDGTSTTEIPVGKANGGESDVPFSNKAWVLIRKGGAAQSIKLKYSKLNVVYNRQSFTIPTDAEFSYIPVGL